MPKLHRRANPSSPVSLNYKTDYSSSSSSVSSVFSGPKLLKPQSVASQKALRGRAGFLKRTEPRHEPSAEDVYRCIKVWSKNDGRLIEVTATFVNDISENWISAAFLARVQKDKLPNVNDKPAYGRIGLKTVELYETVELTWRDGRYSNFIECRIVKDASDSFDIYLKESLLPRDAPIDLTRGVEPQLTKEAPEPTIPLPVTLSNEPIVDTPSVSSPAGSFDGLAKEIDETANECRDADSWMKLLEETLHSYIKKPEDWIRADEEIKIAVLDTGIDPTHPSIKAARQLKRIKIAKSFVTGSESSVDAFGHGTHVANLLLDVAPEAELYVGKIAETEDIPSDHRIAEAIRWAIEMNVDIISMSFGLGKDNAEVQDAINAAGSKNIIMFAAASNGGGNHGVTYPAKYDGVICVFSTDGLGNSSPCNPSQIGHPMSHFATLGEGVKSAWPKHLQNNGGLMKRMTGTSFATPIAAGVAACVLEFVLMNGMEKDLYRKLRRMSGIRSVFRDKMAIERDGRYYLHPWKLFGDGRTKKRIIALISDTLEHGS